jgi:hypothetical protein
MALFQDNQTVYLNRTIEGLAKGQAAKVIKTLDGTKMSEYMAKKHGLVVCIQGKGQTRLKKIRVKLINPPLHLKGKKEILDLSESLFS